MLTNSHLVDTSAWLYALRRDFLPAVKDRIDHLLQEDVVVTTGIVKLEILGGTKNEDEFNRLKSRLDSLDSIHTDELLWELACKLGFDLKRKGVTVPYTDILIASCALQAHCTIVHADAHFDLIAAHVPLKVESFVQAARSSASRNVSGGI